MSRFNIFSYRGDRRPVGDVTPEPEPVDGHTYADRACECGDPLTVSSAYWVGERPCPEPVVWDRWWDHVRRLDRKGLL